MTLIESALRKLQGDTQRKSSESTQRNRKLSDTTAGQPYTGPMESFLPATLDAAAMEQHCILPQMTDESAQRAYKILRTRLLQRLSSRDWHTLAVTGTQAQQGKTLTAINLAMALAQDIHTSVFLVDLDLRRPKIATYLGLKFEHGLGDYLLGAVEADKIIYETGLPRLAIIPNSKPLENASELLSSSKMTSLLQLLASGMPRRIVIFDMPPLLLSDDLLAFAPNIDGILLVVTEGDTTRASLESAKEILAEMNVVGVILNRSSERNDSYNY
jgi:protein-tyrosine kinase